MQIPYDVLIVAVGAVNNTFHTPGVREHAFFLKEVRCAASPGHCQLCDHFEVACLTRSTLLQTGDAALLRNRVNECVCSYLQSWLMHDNHCQLLVHAPLPMHSLL